MQAPTYTVAVASDKAGCRLDRLLADALPAVSRSRLKSLIQNGMVAAAGSGSPVLDPAQRVRPGETFVVTMPPPPLEFAQAQTIPLVIAFEDEHLIVVDKPAGLVVHPGAGNPDRTLVNALLAHCGKLSSIGAPARPGIVHRLDKDTSGLLVAARTDAAHLDLVRQFARRSVERAYQAVVWGHPQPPAGRISGAIGRNQHDRKKMAVVVRGGKEAVTGYRTLGTYGAVVSLIECRLATGRTHQIRVHMAFAGHPIVGDPVYGRRGAGREGSGMGKGAATSIKRQALHAYLIGFKHPNSGEEMRFLSPLPNDIKELLDSLERI